MSNLQTGGVATLVLVMVGLLYLAISNMSRHSLTEGFFALFEWAWEWIKVIVIVALLGGAIVAFLEGLGALINWII